MKSGVNARSAGFIPAFFSWIQGTAHPYPGNLSGETGFAGDLKRETLRAPFPVRIGPGDRHRLYHNLPYVSTAVLRGLGRAVRAG